MQYCKGYKRYIFNKTFIKTYHHPPPSTRARMKGVIKGGVQMSMGYKACRSCGSLHNCADLISGLCPECARERARVLASYQREYQKAVDAGDFNASQEVSDLIRDYQQSEQVRLQAVALRYRV